VKKPAIIFLVCLALAYAAAAQSTGGTVEWMRVESPSGDISFEIPSSGNIVFNDDKGYRIWHAEPGVSLYFRMSRNVDAKAMIRFRAPGSTDDTEKLYEMGDFVIRRSTEKPIDPSVDFQSLTVASSKGYYVISASEKQGPREAYAMFMNSIRLNDKPLFVHKESLPEVVRTVRINELETDQIVLDALKRPEPKGLKLEPGIFGPPELNKTVYSRPLIVLEKPTPSYTSDARSSGVSGTVVLVVTFQADGQIGGIVLKKFLDKGLDKKAFEAARKIKFLPAEVDGKPVETTATFEYSFSVY